MHEGLNCFWGGNGADEVDPQGTQAPLTDGTLLSCLDSCISAPSYSCDGVLWLPGTGQWVGQGQCYRKKNIVVEACLPDPNLVLYLRSDAYPPTPPPSPFAPGGMPPWPPGFGDPPMEPPYPPPPPSRWLNAEQCVSFWQDPHHRFHQLFGEEGWKVRVAGDAACWDSFKPFGFDGFFDALKQGRDCSRNWYTGNWGRLGWKKNGGPTNLKTEPHFTAKHAPALLGFDENIDEYCQKHGGATEVGHSQQCIASNVNILSLYGDDIPYNVCRNIEWQTCAAMGKLPGQGTGRGSDVLRFAKAPRNLEPRSGDRPLGACFGYHPEGCDKGYSSSDIFFLEACYYNQICSNAEQLWTLSDGQDWICHFSEPGLYQLVEWLRAGVGQFAPPAPPPSNSTNSSMT